MRIGTGRLMRLVAALACLGSLSANLVHGQPKPSPQDRLTLSLPGAAWVVEIRTPGFIVQKDEGSSDGMRRYVYAVGQDPDVALSVRLERTSENVTPAECRRVGWNSLRARSPFRMDEVAMSETKELSILEYRVKEFQGLPVDQRHLHGYLAKDDVCVEVHVSKVRSTAADRGALAAILESARIRPRVL